MPFYQQQPPPGGHGPLPKRTLDYLAHGAAQGQRNDELFFAAQQFRDAGYPIDQASPRLTERAILDGLPEGEIRKTLGSAYSQPTRPPAGGPVTAPGAAFVPGHHNMPGAAQNSVPEAPGPSEGPSGARAPRLPSPIPDGLAVLLETAFLPGEFVSIGEGWRKPDGTAGISAGTTAERDCLLAILAQQPASQIYPSLEGVYVRINPMAPGGTADKDVTAFRHVLAEFDSDGNGNDIPLAVQCRALLDSGLPVTAIINSGNRSIHGWVRIDAQSLDEFNLRRDIVFRIFEAWNVDSKNKNPSRYSRCPGITRNLYDQAGKIRDAGSQELLYANPDASWAKWVKSQAFPRLIYGAEIRTVIKPLPPEVISGVLSRGEKGQLAGGSKGFKTWSLIDQGLSIAAGAPWWGIPTAPSNVIFLNLELDEPFFEARVRDVARARGIQIPDSFHVWHLRGQHLFEPVRWLEFLEALKDQCALLPNPFLTTDPIYKLLGGRNENAAGDVQMLLEQLEEMVRGVHGSNFFGHHYSKGNQADKEAIDRGAGSGVFQRDPDTIFTMTEQKTDDCYSVKPILRNHQPIEPFVIEWKYPVFVRNDTLDPEDLKPRKVGRPQTYSDDIVMAAIYAAESSGGITFTKLLAATGMKKTTFARGLKKLLDAGEIMVSKLTGTYQLSVKNSQKWSRTL